MISYQDKTFCPFHENCKNGKTCHKAFTEKVKEGAKRMGLGIAVYMSEPHCYEEISKN